MKDYVFLLGRPGCGKSFVYENILKRLRVAEKINKVRRLDDFPVLKELLDKDKEFKRHLMKEGGFEVTDFTIVDEALRVIDGMLPAVRAENDIVFVEFARDSYLSAFKNFSAETFKTSLLVYIFCPFDVCLARNRKRFEDKKGNALDDHIVPTDLMMSYYKNDDIEKIYLENKAELREFMPADYFVLDNSKNSVDYNFSRFDALMKKIK